MKVVIFGATGDLGGECLAQCLEAGHEVRVLARTPSKLPEDVSDRISIVAGDALDESRVDEALQGAEAVLFAVGVDRDSPEDLCTDITRHILEAMSRHGVRRFVWCGGGGTLTERDKVTLGSRFVVWFSDTFMGLRSRDKRHQLDLLEQSKHLQWLGIRPLQMKPGPRRAAYKLGYDSFSGLSKIHFADAAHAMVRMLDDDTWLHEAPIIQY